MLAVRLDYLEEPGLGGEFIQGKQKRKDECVGKNSSTATRWEYQTRTRVRQIIQEDKSERDGKVRVRERVPPNLSAMEDFFTLCLIHDRGSRKSKPAM